MKVLAAVTFFFLICGLLFIFGIMKKTRRNTLAKACDIIDNVGSLCSTHITRNDFLTLMGEGHRKQVEVLPRFTTTGWLLLQLPLDLKIALVKEYHQTKSASETSPEKDAALVEFDSEESRPGMTWITGSRAELALREWLLDALAKWSRIPVLEHKATYGVRTYKHGSKLTPHTDRYLTHVISAIIHVEKREVRQEWPLHVVPHDASHVQSLFLTDTADCLFYESATVPHGRLEPLDGEEYSNLFAHFMPRGWDKEAKRIMTQ